MLAKPPGYWDDFAVLEREILAFIVEHGTLARWRAMCHSKRLGLRLADTRRSHNHWADFANLERELIAFVAEPGRPQRMPSLTELIAADRFDLLYHMVVA